MKNTLILLTAAVLLSSCAAIKRTAYTQKVATTAMIQAPLIAELEVDPTKKVKANYVARDSNEKEAKEAVLYVAMDQNGCDVIVQPRYELKISRHSIDATVTGMCGKYTNVRKPNLEDVTLLQELNEAMPMFDPNIRVITKRESIFKR
jgi:hypothetical protein